jgi:hypothetical protein
MTFENVHIYFNEQYPHGYTTASNSREAHGLAVTLVEETNKPWSVVSGSNHWKTGKPAYYIVWTEQS